MNRLVCAKCKRNQLIKMSQGNSIFSSPNGSNGEAPANPFASLGSQKAASPFAAVPSAGAESPFGFAAEEPQEKPQARLPERRAQAPLPAAEDNPFLSAAAAPQGEAAPRPAAEAPASPFTSESAFEALAPRQEAYAAPAENPLSSPAPEQAVRLDPQPSAPRQEVEQPVRREEPSYQAAPAAAAGFSSAPAPAPAPATGSSSSSSGNHSTRQLELRAIFGVEGEMSRDEILKRAKGLPGIREVTVVGPGETSAVQTIGEVMSRFGYGGSGSWQMTCSGGVVDFISSENTTLAILREGRYPAGVWETLMIVARELGRLS